MMIGPSLLASAMVEFVWWLEPTGIFKWVFGIGLGTIAAFFFVFGLRRVIYGGHWSCTVDEHSLTWTYPERMGKQGQRLELKALRAFVFRVDQSVDETRYCFYFRTDAGKFEIHSECFGRLKRFLLAILIANPWVELEVEGDAPDRLWGGYGRMMGDLNKVAMALRDKVETPPQET